MLKVLIAEDDLIIADTITEAVTNAGYDVCGVATTVMEGIVIGRAHRPDLAIIDLLLAGGGRGTDIAEQLRNTSRIGVLYASGYINQRIDLAPGDACIAKPFELRDLLCALKIVESGSR